jgi:hypothetical protein
MRHALLAGLVLLAPSCVVSFGPRAWVSDEDTFEADRADLSRVSCATHNGSVTVASGAGDKILVRVTKKAGGRDELDAEDALAAIEITHKRVAGGLALGWRWRQERDSSWQAVVSFDVTQPADLPLVVDTHNGRVRLSGLVGAIKASTHNGSLTLVDCSGKVEGETHNGHVEATLASADVHLETHNGGMRVALRGTGPLNGAIKSHNGHVHLDVDGERSARLVCTTRNGRVSYDRALHRVETGRSFLVADLGDASGRLEVETHNGSIRVE